MCWIMCVLNPIRNLTINKCGFFLMQEQFALLHVQDYHITGYFPGTNKYLVHTITYKHIALRTAAFFFFF